MPARRRALPCALLLALLALSARGGEVGAVDAAAATITEKELREHVTFIASDALAGRAPGTVGCRRAAEYLQEEFRAMKLQPLGDKLPGKDARGYFQAFKVVVATQLAAGGKGNYLTLKTGDRSVSFPLAGNFLPLASSASAEVKDKEVVFVGYGITDRKSGYDDYARVKVEGKVVVVLRYDHAESTAARYKSGPRAWLSTKVRNAMAHGAAGVIIVNGPNSLRAGKADPFIGLGGKRVGNDRVPVAQAKQLFLQRLFADRDEKPAELQKMMDRLKQPGSIPIKGKTVSLGVNLLRVKRPTQNVVGLITGRDAKLKKEYLVVGAHYDHVGLGLWGSRGGKLARGKVHNGANDNGSGVAAVLEVAEAVAGLARRPRRSIVFALFSAEERGLAGSRHFVKHPPVPGGKIAAMLNADMVGRPEKPGKLYICGSASSPVFKEVVARANAEPKLDIQLRGAAHASSDHLAFLAAGIPVLFFFTGFDKDYHTPGDDAEKLSFPDHARVSRHLLRTALALAEREGPIGRRDAPPGRRGVRLGIKPDPKKTSTVAQVIAGTPAAKAGMKKGDLIVEMNGRMITDMVDIYRVLVGLKPGDEAKVKVLRNTPEGDEFVDLTVKF